MGTSELYAVVEELPEVSDSLVVHLEDDEGGAGELVLFVVADLDDDLRAKIASALRSQLSPRHVPDTIAAVPAIPRTLTGKKLEAPVKRILRGAPADSVASRGALAEPRAIDAFVQFTEERGRRDDGRPAGAWRRRGSSARRLRTAAGSCGRRWRSSRTRPASGCSYGAGPRRRRTASSWPSAPGDGDWVELTWGEANRKATASPRRCWIAASGPSAR